MILKRPRDRQHGGINPDPPATAQLQHAITWKPYGLVPFFGYSTPKACLGVRRTSLTTKQNQDEIACDHKEIPYSDANILSTPESTAIYGVPSTRNQAPKNESYEETPTCVLRHRSLPNRPKQKHRSGHLLRHASKHSSDIHLGHTNAEKHL